MQQSLWPIWLPFPISWARAGANAAVFSAIAKGVAASARKVDEPEDMIPIVLVGLFLHFAIVVLGHYCIAKLKGRSGWFPSWLSWREGINGSIVLMVELSSTSIFVIFLAATIDFRSDEAGKNFVAAVLAFFFVIAAYLYHYDFLVRRQRATRQKAQKFQRQQPSTPVPPLSVDPVEVELNQLRGQMGLTQVKRNRRRKRSPG